MQKIAIYGKGGIGKSTITSNLSAAFAALGKKVIQIGYDPKADSTINLLGGEPLQPVMSYMREFDKEPDQLDQISRTGFGGVLCIETGGPNAFSQSDRQAFANQLDRFLAKIPVA